MPRPKSWKTEKCFEWLKLHPITSEEDRLFLINKEREFRTSEEKAIQEKQQRELLAVEETGFRWNEDCTLRMIHCAMEDKVKQALLEQYAVDSREEYLRTSIPNAHSTFILTCE